MILFISIGIVCASDNNESNTVNQETIDTPHPIDEIDDAINNVEDNGTIQLENEYYLKENKTVNINKSITFNGAENRTVIEGNNNYLNLDAVEDIQPVETDKIVLIYPDDGLKKTGKHLIFNNITFKNIKIKTWHNMEFNNCEFINSTFISEELDNKFNDCIFNNSQVELTVVEGFFTTEVSRVFNGFSNCQFYESELKAKVRYTPTYIHVVGGDFYRVYDVINISDSNFTKSKILINDVYFNADNTIFNATNLTGHSNEINIKNSEFSSQNIDFSICKTNITDSVFKNTDISLQATYFSMGTLTKLNNCSLNNTNIKISPGFRSRPSQIRIAESNITNSYLDTTDAAVIIEKSELENTEMLLSFTSLKITDSTISNNDTAKNTIKTKLNETRKVWNGENYTNKTVHFEIKTDYNITNTYFINESGKWQLSGDEISENTLNNFTFIKQEVYLINNELVFILKDHDGNPVSGEKIYVEIEGKYTYPTPFAITDENGIAKYCIKEGGVLNMIAYYYSPGFDDFDGIMNRLNFNITVKSPVDDLKVTKYNFNVVTYSNIKSYLKIKLISKADEDLSNIKLTVKVKNKKYNVYSNSKGEIKFNVAKNLDAGSYKLKITVPYTKIAKSVSLKVGQAKTSVKASKVTNKFKKSKYFKVTVKNKVSKKLVSKVKVKIKVYTGKKFKTYTVKTDKNGIAKINTKKLKVGKHKVIISSGDKNYKISAKSQIKIEK